MPFDSVLLPIAFLCVSVFSAVLMGLLFFMQNLAAKEARLERRHYPFGCCQAIDIPRLATQKVLNSAPAAR